MKTKMIIAAILGIANAGYSRCGIGNLVPATGNSGLGVASPANKLHIVDCTVNGGITVDQQGTIGAAGVALKNSTNPLGRTYMLCSSGIGNVGGAGHFQLVDYGTGPFSKGSPIGWIRLHVDGANGNVGIGSTAPGYKLHVSDDATNMINNPQFSNGPYVEPGYSASYHELLNSTKTGWHAGITGYDLNNAASATGNPNGSYAVNGIGVFGKAVRTTTPKGFSFSIGVYGKGIGSAFNVGGVFYGDSQAEVGNKSISGNNSSDGSGFGIWASSGSNATAGYLNGDAYSTAYYQASDVQLKNETKPIINAVDKLNKLKPSSFTFKTDEFKSMNLPTGQQMGLNAQDVENDFPELVKELKDLSTYFETRNEQIKSYKAINYTNLIPLLIAGVQEQQTQIESLSATVAQQKQMIDALINKTGASTGMNDINTIPAGFNLEQNIPNPFSNETVIKYTVPSTVVNASMVVYDLSGKQVASFQLTEKGTSSLTITSEKLAAGIYLYSVMADGKIIDTKRMVVAQK